MVEVSSEIDQESDCSSMDGNRDSSSNNELYVRRLDSMQQENRVLKTELETFRLQIRGLQEQNEMLKRKSVNIQAKAEQEEEFISNTLLKKITELKKEKEFLAINYEQEEECLTNELNKKYVQLKQEKDKVEKHLAKEQQNQINKLMRRIEKLETDVNVKQNMLDKVRREKVELENALEHEQEALVNRLWKKMEKLENEKKVLQEKLESASAPISGSSSVQNLSAANVNNSVVSTNSTSPYAHNGSNTSSQFDRSSFTRNSLKNMSTTAVHGSNNQIELPSDSSISTNRSSTGNRYSNISFHSLMETDGVDRMRPDSLHQGSQGISSEGYLHSHHASHSVGYRGMPDAHVQSASTPQPSRQSCPLGPPPPPSTTTASSSFGLVTPSGHLLPPGLGKVAVDSAAISAYVQQLREDVTRLRQIFNQNRQTKSAKMAQFDREQESAERENQRLRRLLQTEVERREALCRQLSESESSLEMEDERQFNEASRCNSGSRLRTTSDSVSPVHPMSGHGGLFGPGHAYAVAMDAARVSTSNNASLGTCPTCGQAMASPPTPPRRLTPSSSTSSHVMPSSMGIQLMMPPAPSTPSRHHPHSSAEPSGSISSVSPRRPLDTSLSAYAHDYYEDERCATPPLHKPSSNPTSSAS